jgi:S1-C subfamily serine protease
MRRPPVSFLRVFFLVAALLFPLSPIHLAESAGIDNRLEGPQSESLAIDDYKQAVPKVATSVQQSPGQMHMQTLGSASLVGDKIAVTDFHVVDGYSSLYLVFKSGATVPVKVVTGNKASDYAILRADSSLPATPFKIATVDSIKAGDTETVVGYRQDLVEQPSVKVGKVLGFTSSGPAGPDGRTYPYIEGDAAASFGDSGGAILSDAGLLMAIVVGGTKAPDGRQTMYGNSAALIASVLAKGWTFQTGTTASATTNFGASGQPSDQLPPYMNLNGGTVSPWPAR